jgi:hypothetical protein
MTSLYAPEVCMHLLGRMLQVVGPGRILWGTDSIWNGSPQGQIERMRRLQIRPELIDRFGYPQLTDAVKAQVLGLNAARLFGVDPDEIRHAIRSDRLSSLRAQSRRDPDPSRMQYGWTWVEDRANSLSPPVTPRRIGHSSRTPRRPWGGAGIECRGRSQRRGPRRSFSPRTGRCSAIRSGPSMTPTFSMRSCESPGGWAP